MLRLICALGLATSGFTLPALAEGSLLLVGGGSEDYNDWSDKPYRWFVERAGSRSVLVMHYATTSSFLPSYFRWLGATASENLVVSSRLAADDSATYRAVKEAGAVFLRGGDQWRYVSLWKGTLLEQALRELYEGGAAVGGTSAGMVILSELVFDARITSVRPRDALRDPLNAGVSFTEDFLPFLPGALLDSHFFERGRIGRLAAMIALYRIQASRDIAGVGVDYHTALAVAPDGVGTVMGAGTVTILRLAGETTVRLEPARGLGVENLRLDQLTEGFAYDFTTGAVSVPATAEEFHPELPVQRGGVVLLDGSADPLLWRSASGSLSLLAASLPPGASVCIVAADTMAADVASVRDFLLGLGSKPVSVLAWPARSEDASTREAISSCGALVFLENNPDSLAGYLRPGTGAGEAFFEAVDAGIPAVFLADDAMLAGIAAIEGTESHVYAAYYGYMAMVPGAGRLAGLSIMPRLYEDPDYVDNRASGCFWALAMSAQGMGVLLDEGSVGIIEGNALSVRGATPAMVIDARRASWKAFPTWRDPGKSNPRQNAALVGALLHVVPSEGSLSLGSTTEVDADVPAEVRSFRLEPAYPNPFNGTTLLAACIERPARVRLTIVDIQGRELDRLLDRAVSPGVVTVRWEPRGLPSGIYFARLQAEDLQDVVRIALIR